MTWVYRDGKIVEKTGPVINARSDLPCPNIIRDGLLEPLQHMADGRMYDSKRAMEKADRAAGCICVGNEQPKQLAPDPMPPWKDDVAQAYEKVKQGYKPNQQIERGLGDKSGWI